VRRDVELNQRQKALNQAEAQLLQARQENAALIQNYQQREDQKLTELRE
jgi:hypothetical protein